MTVPGQSVKTVHKTSHLETAERAAIAHINQPVKLIFDQLHIPSDMPDHHVQVVLAAGMGLTHEAIAKMLGYSRRQSISEILIQHKHHVETIKQHANIILLSMNQAVAYQCINALTRDLPDILQKPLSIKEAALVHTIARSCLAMNKSIHDQTNNPNQDASNPISLRASKDARDALDSIMPVTPE